MGYHPVTIRRLDASAGLDRLLDAGAVEAGSPSARDIEAEELPVYEVSGVTVAARVVGPELWVEAVEGEDVAGVILGLAERYRHAIRGVRLWSIHRPAVVERWMRLNMPEARHVTTEYLINLEEAHHGRQQ